MNLEQSQLSIENKEAIVQSQKPRKKNLQKKLTETDPFKQEESSTKVCKKKSQTILSKSIKQDKSKDRSMYSYQENDSVKQKEKNSSFANNHQKSLSNSNTESEDEELKKYVREFKKKVEKKYNESITNKNFKFVYNDKKVFDSESSIQSQMDVEQYNLADQNKVDSDKDETEQLVDLIQEIGQLDKFVLTNELR